MKKVLRKSNLVAGVLVVVVVCLGIVLAGDVIIKEGDMDVGDVNSAGDGEFTGNLTVGTSSSQNHLYLESNGLPMGSIRGGSIAWDGCYGYRRYTYINAGLRFVWDASAQATEFDTGVGWVDFDDGDAHFEGDLTAKSYTDNTPAWAGTSEEALQSILFISSKNGEIDHSSLPDIARHIRYKEDYEGNLTDEIEFDGRDLGGMVTVLVEAVKALHEENQMLKVELAKLKEAVGIE